MGGGYVTESDFIKAGFHRSGDFLTRGNILIWICEDEDRLDRYFYEGVKITTREQLNEIEKQGNIHSERS